MDLGREQDLSPGKAKDMGTKVFLQFSRQKAGEGRRKRQRPQQKKKQEI